MHHAAAAVQSRLLALASRIRRNGEIKSCAFATREIDNPDKFPGAVKNGSSGVPGIHLCVGLY